MKPIKAIFEGKKVKVTKIVTRKDDIIPYPIILLAYITWKDKDGDILSNWVSGRDIEFIDND